jgi:signal transduction histidine kinase
MAPAFPPFRATLGVKLALALFAIVMGALGIVYLMVVPQLEERLVDAKVRQLEQAAGPLVGRIRSSFREGPEEVLDTVAFASSDLDARIVVLRRFGDDQLLRVADSGTGNVEELVRDPVALAAVRAGQQTSGRTERGDREFGEVARPVGNDVLLLSASIEDDLATVGLVRRSLVVAGLVALAAAAALAYAAALGLTRRLRRLESAADRIAAGNFAEPVGAGSGSDEVAQLGRAFDSMRERLADLDRVRREFIANASHELRTPLFSLGGFLELLADEDLDPATRREFLAETRAQVDRLARLATDLLDLSRLDAGQLEVDRERIDLAEAARTVAEEFRAVAEASEHPLTVSAPAGVAAVGDHERVLQIARILVENAMRHTPAGTRVEVAVATLDGRATLTVRDQGPGIPPEDQPHVFERFYRAGGGKAFGSGLGLAIASELATRMGGTLRLSAAPGETVFELELAALPPETDRRPTPAEQRGGARDETPEPAAPAR